MAVNEANSKHSQISRILINFHGKILILKEKKSLWMTIQIPALLKEFKVLHEPCSYGNSTFFNI